ncbi:CAMK/CAMK-unique protein kinase [Coprinopsis sp. MPI-PUGE-AT-0042]|nr:CAMK/CAMK-unique protein kinase [Coprinopsis sp. MPI-PUGE-AT-0042]
MLSNVLIASLDPGRYQRQSSAVADSQTNRCFPRCPLANDNLPSSYFSNNDRQSQPLSSSSLRFQKDPYTHRSIANSRLPAPIVPLSISTNLVPSPSVSTPSTASGKHPRSPYISSRPLSSSSPAPFRAPQSSGPTPPSALSQCASMGSSFPIEDVLAEGDIVGEGLLLQGEFLRLVGSGNETDDNAPAKEFEVVRVLGTGSYAVVYLVKEVLFRPPPSDNGHMDIGSMDMDSISQTQYGREFAIKWLSKANLDEEALTAQMSEVTIHQSLPLHSNIVTLHRTFETSSFLLLLLEYVPGEDLYYFLEQARDHYEPQPSSELAIFNSRTPPTPSLLSNLHPSQLLSRTRLRLIASMFSQMCEAVATCHSQHVFHRDIKPENFIVTDAWVTLPNGQLERKVIVKLTDFGLSTTEIESAPYMSYECRNNVAPTYRPRAADVWSLGIVLINMLYHFNPWTDTEDGACSSFDLYRRDPINFFINQFLATKVFCLLDGDEDDRRRELVTLLGSHGMQRTLSTNSTHGHSLTSIPVSHRPMSRTSSNATNARAPSFGPAYEREEKSELSTVIDQDNEDDFDDADASTGCVLGSEFEETQSRAASTSKRKGATSGPISSQDDTKSLARELSKQSKTSVRAALEPVSMYAMPSSILSAPSRNPPRPLLPASSPSKTTPSAPTKRSRRDGSLALARPMRSTLTANLASEEPAPPKAAEPAPAATTVNNVTNLIMSLNAPPNAPAPAPSDDTWARGRKPREPSPLNSYARSRRGPSNSSQPSLLEGPPSRATSRAISPSSTRSGRPLANSSARSISTTATSVSGASWRTSVKPSSIASSSVVSASGGYTSVPKNIKNQLPRGQCPDPAPAAPRKQRTRKPKDTKLDTITERPPGIRKDAMTSTSDLTDGDSAGGVKKVHKGQINALAKMLQCESFSAPSPRIFSRGLFAEAAV